MEPYEIFKKRNINFDESSYFIEKGLMEKAMKENYDIACNVEKRYNETFGNIEGPRIGDIVEFSDGFEVYKHAKVVENPYGGSAYGMLCVCERGSSFTNGEYFSTSGGAFKAFHKSKFQYAGEEENVVWSWGCHGAGASQGIYFPLKVRKWIIPYDPMLKQSRVIINGVGKKDWKGYSLPAVWIERYFAPNHYRILEFETIKAFRAWAEYVGFVSKPYNGIFDRYSFQNIIFKYFWDKSEVPENAKPIKAANGSRLCDAYVVNDGNIVYYIPNVNTLPERPKYGTKEYEEEFAEFLKYKNNPLGV